GGRPSARSPAPPQRQTRLKGDVAQSMTSAVTSSGAATTLPATGTVLATALVPRAGAAATPQPASIAAAVKARKQRVKSFIICNRLQPSWVASARYLLEAAQGFDLLIEGWHAVHGIEHHHLGAEPLPALGCLGPQVGIGFVHAQPAFKAEFRGIAAERLEMLAQRGELRLGIFGRHDAHPAIADARGALDHGI